MRNKSGKQRRGLGFDSLFKEPSAPRARRVSEVTAQPEPPSADQPYVSKTSRQKERARLERERVARGEHPAELQRLLVAGPQPKKQSKSAAKKQERRTHNQNLRARRIREAEAARARLTAGAAEPRVEVATPIPIAPKPQKPEPRTVLVRGAKQDPLRIARNIARMSSHAGEQVEIYADISQVHRNQEVCDRLKKCWRATQAHGVQHRVHARTGSIIARALMRFNGQTATALAIAECLLSFPEEQAGAWVAIAEGTREIEHINRARQAVQATTGAVCLQLGERLARLTDDPQDLAFLSSMHRATLSGEMATARRTELKVRHVRRLARLNRRDEARALAATIGIPERLVARAHIYLTTKDAADLARFDADLHNHPMSRPYDMRTVIRALVAAGQFEAARAEAHLCSNPLERIIRFAIITAASGDAQDLRATRGATKEAVEEVAIYDGLRLLTVRACIRCGKHETAMQIAETVKQRRVRARTYLTVYCALNGIEYPFGEYAEWETD